MAALALMILVVAVLATGATRHEVYRSSGGRVGGRVGKEKQEKWLISKDCSIQNDFGFSLYDIHSNNVLPATLLDRCFCMLRYHDHVLCRELGCL